MLAGTSLILAGAWPVLLISVVIFLSKISSEERLMAEQFGEQYLGVQEPSSAVSSWTVSKKNTHTELN